MAAVQRVPYFHANHAHARIGCGNESPHVYTTLLIYCTGLFRDRALPPRCALEGLLTQVLLASGWKSVTLDEWTGANKRKADALIIDWLR